MLITGANGMLATDLAREATDAGYQVVALSHEDLDVTDPGQVRRTLEELRPQILVNTPGIGVDACEEQPEAGYRVHTWAASLAAAECHKISATYVGISTCGLFGDEVKFYSEYDPVELKTQYSRSKYLGEQAAIQACRRTFIIRPGWLFGGTPEHRRNFVYQRFLEARSEPVLRSAQDKFGSPTCVSDLAKKILELLQSQQYGTYHVSNSGSASRFEYVKCIMDAFGLTTPVEAVDSSYFPRTAPVPDCEVLANSNLKFLGLAALEPWQDAIERYARQLKAEIGL